MIFYSCIVSALSMLCAAAYLLRKFRGTITASSLLMICLLIFYGPASFVYLLYYSQESVIYGIMEASPYFGKSVSCLHISIAIMLGCCVLAIEVCDRAAPRLSRKLTGSEDWSDKPLARDTQALFWLLLGCNVLLAIVMTSVSIYEDHVGIVAGFFRASGSEAKDAYRLAFGGSKIYPYRVLLEAVAPFVLIWGILEFTSRRAYLALLSSAWLFLAIFVGRADTLSKAPVALIILELVAALMLCRHNRLSWRFIAMSGVFALAVFYPLIGLALPEVAREGTEFSFFFRRSFAILNETLLEFFTAFPHYLSYTFGTNIRPVALLAGQEFRPAYIDVPFLWHSQHGSTSNAMFIADAWAAFSFVGVALASLFVGAICRSIDLVFFSRGKSTMNVAVLAAVLVGVLRLMIDSASTALVSGGLLIVPLFALTLLGVAGLFEPDAEPANKVALTA
ncbi:hypothetical protein [Bradyrhizobium liaoningense]|uniref:hypothetical protein n=1 Tax=Bradyrhizobium liaoningense TaxID=43992 RepID=UPI001BA661D6|nr:hypothetical protein [Bradyrhizobium liaoningense]MBR1033046.1 hypothetical protein [Bradyrhizobium liaoningense]